MKAAEQPVPFNKLEQQKPDMADVDLQMRRARLHLRLALKPESARSALLDMQQVAKKYQTAAEIARIHAFHEPQNQEAAERARFFDQGDIQFSHYLQQFYAALLGSRYRSYLEQQYGSHLFRLAEQFRTLIQPEAAQDLLRERQLVRQHSQLMQAFRFELDGQSMTRMAYARCLYHPDRRTRQQACQAYGSGLAEMGEPLDGLFSELMRCRSQIAEKLGFASFADLAWQRLGYTDIQRKQVSRLHGQIQRYIFPLTREIRHLQRRRLNLEQLAGYDQASLLPEGLPQLQLPLPKLLPMLADVVQQHSETAFPLRQLQKQGYTLLQTARNKEEAGRRYSAYLAENGLPYTLLCSDGSVQDLQPMLRQIGMAFAGGIQSVPDSLIEYILPSPLLKQTYGQIMALLLLPHLEPALGITHDDYLLLQLSEALLGICQDCLVDAFEEQLYAQPDLSATERRTLWLNLERTYLPDLDHEQTPFFADGRAWQAIDRIWQQPFGQIGRTIALLSSLDIWRLARHNPPGAWRRYVNLCRLGSQKPYLDLLGQADLPSPLDMATVKKVAYAICSDLSL